MSAANPKEFPDLGAIFDAHLEGEFADRDVDLLDPANLPVSGAEQATKLLRATEPRGAEHAEAIAKAAVFLASDQSKHITGQEFRVGSHSDRAKSVPKPAGVVNEYTRNS